MSLIVRTEQIVAALQDRMNSITFKWKGDEATTAYVEDKPKVYAFTYDELSNGFPINTPSVCVQLVSVDDNGTASYLVHCCVCNPATQDKEITHPVKDEVGVYEYGDTSGYDSSCVRSELFKFCLLLGEQVYLGLKRMGNTNQDITNVELTPPSPYLAEFPYAECTVSFESDVKNIIEDTNRTTLEHML